jgi:hypothetical protein
MKQKWKKEGAQRAAPSMEVKRRYRRAANPIGVADPAMPRGEVRPMYHYGPTPNDLDRMMKETVQGGFVGLPPASPFDAALWGFTSRITAVKAAGEASHLRGNVGEVKSLARHIKMLSMNPSVYGNAYGVLGNS